MRPTGVRVRSVLILPLVAGLAGCGGGDRLAGAGSGPSAPADQRYATTTTVLESADHGPQACLSGVAESLPPQCTGPDVVGWDWGTVDGEQTAAGTTWGTFHVVGTWDGERLTLTEPPRAPQPVPDEAMDFSTPCEAPPGGWRPVDPATSTDAALEDAVAYARSTSDFGGLWVDQSAGHREADALDEESADDPQRLVLNVRFSDDVERHESELRRRWGGALCVTPAERPLSELQAAQREVHDELPGVLGSGIDEVDGVVDVTVPVADPATQVALDERYGEGVVRLSGVMRPVP